MKCYYKLIIAFNFRKMVVIIHKYFCWMHAEKLPDLWFPIFHIVAHSSILKLPRNDFLYCFVLIDLPTLIVIDAVFRCVDMTLSCWAFISMFSFISTEYCPRSPIAWFFQTVYTYSGEPLLTASLSLCSYGTHPSPGSSFSLVSECHSSNKPLWLMLVWVIDSPTQHVRHCFLVPSSCWDHTCPACMWLLGIHIRVLLFVW